MTELALIPGPSERRIAITITRAGERALRNGHPWLFDRSIRKQSRAGRPGDLAVVYDRKKRFLAIGLYDPDGPIRVRILQHHRPATIDGDWFRERLSEAAALREGLAFTGTSGYRLVHGENDRLPGLVIDRYDDTYVIKLYTVAWIPHLANVLQALLQIVDAWRLVLRLSRHVAGRGVDLHGLLDGQVLIGPPLVDPVLFKENGLRFEADLIRGQKTGFFFDQRDNRSLVEIIVRQDHRLKQVLNVFSYTGGFSLYAARSGAKRLVSLDSSEPALMAARRNFLLNQDDPAVARAVHETLLGDAFQLLKKLNQEGKTFDMVIIDPPSFAKKQSETEQALRSYARLTKSGLHLLRTGGTLVMASCSSRIGAEDFYRTIHRTAKQNGRSLSEIARNSHALDHPVGFAEGAYLKCLFARAY